MCSVVLWACVCVCSWFEECSPMNSHPFPLSPCSTVHMGSVPAAVHSCSLLPLPPVYIFCSVCHHVLPGHFLVENALIASSSTWPQVRPQWTSLYMVPGTGVAISLDGQMGTNSEPLGTCRLNFTESYTRLPWGLSSSPGAERAQRQHTRVPISSYLQHRRAFSLPFLPFWRWFSITVLFSSPLPAAFSTSACASPPPQQPFAKHLVYFLKFNELCCFIQLNYLLWVDHLSLFLVYDILHWVEILKCYHLMLSLSHGDFDEIAHLYFTCPLLKSPHQDAGMSPQGAGLRDTELQRPFSHKITLTSQSDP